MAERLFNKNMTLNDMDNVLERALSMNRQDVRIIADLPVSEEDYNILITRLAPVKSNMALLQHYRISVVTAWVFALHYEQYKKADCRYIIEEWKIPQYSYRQFLDICNSVFADFGILMYFAEIHNEEELYNMVITHAGIPDYISGHFCILLEDLVETGDMKKALGKMRGQIGGRLKYALDLTSYTFLEGLLDTAANIMWECKHDIYTEEDLRNRYPLVSSRLIHLCADWVEKQKEVYGCVMQPAV